MSVGRDTGSRPARHPSSAAAALRPLPCAALLHMHAWSCSTNAVEPAMSSCVARNPALLTDALLSLAPPRRWRAAASGMCTTGGPAPLRTPLRMPGGATPGWSSTCPCPAPTTSAASASGGHQAQAHQAGSRWLAPRALSRGTMPWSRISILKQHAVFLAVLQVVRITADGSRMKGGCGILPSDEPRTGPRPTFLPFAALTASTPPCLQGRRLHLLPRSVRVLAAPGQVPHPAVQGGPQLSPPRVLLCALRAGPAPAHPLVRPGPPWVRGEANSNTMQACRPPWRECHLALHWLRNLVSFGPSDMCELLSAVVCLPTLASWKGALLSCLSCRMCRPVWRPCWRRSSSSRQRLRLRRLVSPLTAARLWHPAPMPACPPTRC